MITAEEALKMSSTNHSKVFDNFWEENSEIFDEMITGRAINGYTSLDYKVFVPRSAVNTFAYKFQSVFSPFGYKVLWSIVSADEDEAELIFTIYWNFN